MTDKLHKPCIEKTFNNPDYKTENCKETECIFYKLTQAESDELNRRIKRRRKWHVDFATGKDRSAGGNIMDANVQEPVCNHVWKIDETIEDNERMWRVCERCGKKEGIVKQKLNASVEMDDKDLLHD